MNRLTNILFSALPMFLLTSTVVLISGPASAQDVIETPERVFRGRVTMADPKSITIEMTIQGMLQEITIPRNRIRRLKVEPPPSVVAGIEAYEAGDWRKAKLNLERVILNYQGLDVDWAQRGMVYFGRAALADRDHENAERAFTSFLSAYPDHELVIEAKLGQAEVERVKGNSERALEMFEKLAEPYRRQLRPERDELAYAAEAYLGIGRTLESLDELQAALEAYVKIIALYPVDRFYPETLYRCASISARMGDFDRAERYLSELTGEYTATAFARDGIRLRNAIEQKKHDTGTPE